MRARSFVVKFEGWRSPAGPATSISISCGSGGGSGGRASGQGSSSSGSGVLSWDDWRLRETKKRGKKNHQLLCCWWFCCFSVELFVKFLSRRISSERSWSQIQTIQFQQVLVQVLFFQISDEKEEKDSSLKRSDSASEKSLFATKKKMTKEKTF